MNEADVFRRWGYLQADLDALGRLPPLPHAELDAFPASPWRRIYAGTVGAEFMQLADPARRAWVQAALEAPAAAPDREGLFDTLLRADLFERALQSRYPGTKRFSLEGLTALLPVLEAFLDAGREAGARQILLGMSHRGRLNVMANFVGRPAREIFASFEDVDPRSTLGGGDVKYHLGATGERRGLRIALASNPSHLEAVDPVVLGRARARQLRFGGTAAVLPVLLHGDAAFAGQGIVAETLAMAGLAGYDVGGTVHVVLNNLVGFTTEPASLHPGRFATDAAKRIDVPIFHVNAEDPEACVRVARIAADYRARFGSDVVVDLVGYRRHGHSEVEDPTTTQPRLYAALAARPPLSSLYGARIGAEVEARQAPVRDALAGELAAARDFAHPPSLIVLPDWWAPYRGGRWSAELDVDTGVPLGTLREIARRLAELPPDFEAHPKIRALLEKRRSMAEGREAVDWGAAETLAFGSLLLEGTPVRLSGQDVRRGTFNQRHAALMDVETGAARLPLAELGARFEAVDSPLAEAAPLGFEFGYSREVPEALVLWEAQFGDFANGAQVILDQYLSASEDKWGLLSGLVLLLPHGYEGQGPEHSSARLERYLQLCAEDNWQIAQPGTAAQYFHLLRRQARRAWRKPLVVFTPKSLLRRPSAASPVATLAEGRFRPLLVDGPPDADRLLVASGKFVHELREEREKRGDARTALASLEQLYPFPEAELKAAIEGFPALRRLAWVQEEPSNMGAQAFVLPRLKTLAGARAVGAVRRPESASPATGSAKAHALEQAALLDLAFARA